MGINDPTGVYALSVTDLFTRKAVTKKLSVQKYSGRNSKVSSWKHAFAGIKEEVFMRTAHKNQKHC